MTDQDERSGELAALAKRAQIAKAALSTLKFQIVAQGGEFTAPMPLLLQRDNMRNTLRQIENEIDWLMGAK